MGPKKAKAEKMDLGTFLTDKSLGSWADEMEDAPMPSPSGRSTYGAGGGYSSGGGFGSGGLSDRGFHTREPVALPSKPPFTVHLGNMPFDATNGDVEDFFTGCDVSSVRIVEDRMDQKPKGFAYVEFRTLEGITKALDLNGGQFMNRNIRISVAEPQKDRPETREISDWSRKGPLPDLPGQRKGSDRGGFGSGVGGGFERGPPRSFDNASEAGSERGGRRGGFEPAGDGKVRDFGNWDRKGPLTPSLPQGAPARSFERPASRDGPSMRHNSPAWGEGRSQDSGSRPPRREFAEQRPIIEKPPSAAEQDSQWRTKMRPDVPSAPTPQAARSPALSGSGPSAPPSPAAAPAMPASRPKLNLAKRTVSEAIPESTAAPSSDSKASPFGAAKPIDTATREKEVEEKRQQALKDKKEADEKARAEKKIADDKAREDKRLAREAEDAAKAKQSASAPQEKPNGQKVDKPAKVEKAEKDSSGSGPAPGKSFEILRREANEDASAADEEADEAEAADQNGLVTEDKETKPKDIVRDIPSTNGDKPTTSAEPTAEALEDDGWSTVGKPEKKRNKGNPGARAIAS